MALGRYAVMLVVMSTSKLRRTAACTAAVAALFPIVSATAGIGTSGAVIGGEEATNAYSFFGSLQRLDSPRDDLHSCGVTLVAPTFGVTAGHCVRSAADDVADGFATSGRPIGWRVRFDSTRVASGGDLVNVVAFTRLADGRSSADDIAILEFDRAVDAEPVRLTKARPSVGTRVVTMGFGQVSDECVEMNDPNCYPTTLRTLDAEVSAPSTCSTESLTSILCIGADRGRRHAGNMDSGGPAVVHEGGHWVLVGAVQGSSDLGRPDTSSQYVDIARHRAWIEQFVTGRAPMPPPTPGVSPELAGTGTIADCSTSVVSTADARPDDAAYILTNGHCVADRPKPNTPIGAVPERQTVTLRDASGYVVFRGTTTELVYATMSGTDLAVYRLDATYRQLRERGVTPRRPAAAPLAVGDEVTLVSGQWTSVMPCRVEATVALEEGGYRQFGAVRYAKSPECAPGGGYSGSPLVDSSGAVVGIHNTSSADPAMFGGEPPAPCADGNPCQVSSNGDKESLFERAYGQRLMGLGACLTTTGMDFDAAGCGLAAPADRSRPDRRRSMAPWAVSAVTAGGAVVVGLSLVVRRRRGARLEQ